MSRSVWRSKHPAGVWQHVCPAPHFAPPLQLHSLPLDVQVSPVTQSTPVQLHTPLASQRTPAGGLLLGLQALTFVPHVHFPPRHVLFLCMLQLLPQPPQLIRSVATFVSQPLSSPVVGFEQLAKPGSQNDVHAFPVQASVATRVDEHFRLQPPQLSRSSWTGRSQPGAAALVSQSPNPGEHVP